VINKSTYCLMGLGCGSLAGLLFAPKSGSALRAGITRAGKRRQRAIKKQVCSASAAIENYGTTILRALKRTLTTKVLRSVFQ